MKLKTLAIAATAVVALMAGSVDAKTRLRLANSLSEDHPTSAALKQFADEVEQKTDGEVSIRLYLNGVLGSEREVLEQLQNGAVDMTRVSAGNLENFDPIFKAFTLPYIFTSEDQFYRVMTGPVADEVYNATKDSGFIGLTFFDSGARSFYTRDTPINTPADLKGLKIRVMNSNSSIRMVEMMGGTPTPMPYGEIYTALQQGVIDGAENNVTALTIGRHGEVAKYYSQDEHLRVPDFLVISNAAMAKLTPEQQKIVKEAAVHATQAFRGIWDKAIADARTKAEAMGVTFIKPDQAPFREKVMPLLDEYRDDPDFGKILTQILATE
ncbi:TRAP transporter substrate-binding protein [Pseudooceanicola sp. CBS1P-1]|uniref:DctP family TRAP transporter solute-binding subunit n=1 Tax=Pseudooceanicola albus TaxID=2692189 RepID=A0A6L7G5R9_9RHOB|nr:MULTISPECIES: TRAP transporter substrate-binding protein [Pseudooceanicola]MBT9386194.1 TRAP transporter substrate-binding protein [Pseudooceanicola endophyticus]MXN19391.1 DctP family TRAP transporter solute-binding subunit [Pseudooceanicola albus]